MRTNFFTTLLLLLAIGVFAASAQAKLFRGINTARSIPRTAVAAKAVQSLAHQQQILQQQNRLASQRVQRMSQQQILRTQLLNSQQTIQPFSFAPQTEQKKNKVSRVPAKAKEGYVGK